MPRLLLPLLLASASLLAVRPAAAQQAVPDPGATYVVEAGETLWQIAQKTGVESAALLRLNGLDDADLILAGATLKLAGPAAAPPPTPVTHRVADGETLSAIAAAYGATLEALAQANRLDDPNLLVVGAQLLVPGPAGAPADRPRPEEIPTAAPVPTPPPVAPIPPAAPAGTPAAPGPRRSLVTTYVVQPGDTVGSVARQFGVEPPIVAQASGLEDPNLIAVGSLLKIPVPARERVVAEGETLYGIAAQEKVDLGSLIDFNQIADAALINAGQVLLVPAAPQAAASLPPPPPPAAEPSPAPTATPAPTPAAAPPKPAATPPTPAPSASRAAAAPAATPAPTPPPPARRVVPVPPGLPTGGVVGQAVKLLGSAYVFGGSGPTSFDCSGLVWYAFKQAGKSLPRGLFSQYDSGSHPARSELQPGDIVFFQNTYMPGLSHNGIYIGNDQFINAGDEQSGVTISNMKSAYWASRYYGATRPK